MGWLDDLETKGGSSKYYSTKEGQEYTFEVLQIAMPDKGERFNIIGKQYALELTDTDGKVLGIGSITGEICLRKLGKLLREEFKINDPLIGEIVTWRHPKHGVIEMEAKGKRVRVAYDRSKNDYKIDVEDLVPKEAKEEMQLDEEEPSTEENPPSIDTEDEVPF